MNKSKFFSIMFLAIAGTGAIFAQSRVALHSVGQVTIFSGAAPFADAYNAAASGDTIYLSGGAFVAPTEINKGIAVFGAGHYPDSTAVTGQTSVGGNIIVKEGADNLRFEGIFFTGNITFNSNEKVDDVVFVRCRINGTLTYNQNNNMATPCENHLILQCVMIGAINFNNLQGSSITNCIIRNRISNGINLNIANNVFLYFHGYYCDYDGSPFAGGVKGSTMSNNVFLTTNDACGVPVAWGCSECLFVNNLINSTNSNIGGTNNISTNNVFSVPRSNIFVSAADNEFDYTKDYHLQDPETYLGMDGKEVGIYGGSLGYKSGAVPSNPHFSSATIAPTTDGDGKLKVNIKVIAQ